MTVLEYCQMSASVATLLTALGALVSSLRNGRHIVEVKKAANGMQERLEGAAFIAGMREGEKK